MALIYMQWEWISWKVQPHALVTVHKTLTRLVYSVTKGEVQDLN